MRQSKRPITDDIGNRQESEASPSTPRSIQGVDPNVIQHAIDAVLGGLSKAQLVDHVNGVMVTVYRVPPNVIRIDIKP